MFVKMIGFLLMIDRHVSAHSTALYVLTRVMLLMAVHLLIIIAELITVHHFFTIELIEQEQVHQTAPSITYIFHLLLLQALIRQ